MNVTQKRIDNITERLKILSDIRHVVATTQMSAGQYQRSQNMIEFLDERIKRGIAQLEKLQKANPEKSDGPEGQATEG